LVAVAIVAALATAGLAYLIVNIGDRKSEGGGIAQYTRAVPIEANTYDPAVWGKTYKAQYDMYKATKGITPTHHVAAWVDITDAERTTKDAGKPPEADPVRFADAREKNPVGNDRKVTPSKLGEDERLKTLWNGYAFAKDYRHLRGHEWMLTDQQQTLRVLALADRPAEKGGPQPGACANCHASVPYIVDQLGPKDAKTVGTGLNMDGWAEMNKMNYLDLASDSRVKDQGPIGCIDCHDPKTMELRISRPALVAGIAGLKNAERAKEGLPAVDYDVNKDATNQEMRTYVCAQCHVEYYFAPPNKTLTFPWADGADINDVWTYYTEFKMPDESVGFTDFTHADTGAGVVKAQHPEFEAWYQGVHAAKGVACADCHMPYVREGGQKVSNHHIASPMADPSGSCGTCHPGSTVQLEGRVTSIQNTFKDSRNRTLDAVVSLIADIGAAKDDPAMEDRVALARQYQNFANFYVDYAYSENSYGFHAPDYFQRILNQSLNAAREGQRALLGVPVDKLVPVADLNKDMSVLAVPPPPEDEE